jgi:hypothetical protein
MAGDGIKSNQTSGRPDLPYDKQQFSSSNCIQRSPAALSAGIPGITEVIDRPIQQASHPSRHCITLPLAQKV